jgi:hypothetical protein
MSHTKVSAPKAYLYNRSFEYARVVTDVVVTEDGVYQKGQVPDAYSGSQLELAIVWAILMVNMKAELQFWELGTDYPMDKDNKKGGPLVRDGVTVRIKTGDSNVNVVQKLIINENLEEQRKLLGGAALSKFREELATYPTQPQS